MERFGKVGSGHILLCWEMGHFTCSKCKVVDLLWFVYFGMRIGGGAQLLSRSHVGEHTSILLISPVNFIGHMSFLGDKAWHFLVHPFLQLVQSKNPKGYLCPFLSPQNNSSPMLHDPREKSHFNLKTCPWKLHNQHWTKWHSKQPFHRLGKLRV